MTTKGYLAPLTDTSWLFFAITLSVSFVINALHTQQSYLNKGDVNIFNVFTIFAISTFYSQDLRSSTIEPQYESLPDRLSDVNTRQQYVIPFGYFNCKFLYLIAS